MNTSVKKEILDAVKQYGKIILTRHVRPDCDAVGSTLGLAHLLKLNFPEKDIRVINSDYSEYAAFLGEEDGEADDGFYRGALLIATDTASDDRISNKKFKLAEKLIKLDHHIDAKPYGDISWVEDGRSSACEMVADFYLTFKDELKADRRFAELVYTGMVTDSGRFRYSQRSGDSLRIAAELLDFGIDTDRIFANLYLDEYSALKYKAYVYDKMQITANGVVHLFVDREMIEKFGLTDEQASNAVFFMDSIKNCIVWIAFIENPDGSIRVRLRSRFMTINTLAEKYNGGGHACASGATVKDRQEADELIAEADCLVREYKENNTGWL